MKILCTGGCGFLGTALVKALVAKGHFVRTLDDDSRGDSNRLSGVIPAWERWVGDVRDPYEMAAATDGMDTVVHLAAVNGTANFYARPYDVLETGLMGTLNVVNACKKQGVKALYYASSSEVYGDAPPLPTPEDAHLVVPNSLCPRWSYSASKIASELAVLHSGIPRVCVFRPFNVYGPCSGMDHVIPQMISKIRRFMDSGEEVVYQGEGCETRAFCYIDDAVEGILTVMERGEDRGVYNVGVQEEISVRVLREMIVKEMNPSKGFVPKFVPVPEGSPPRRCPDVRKLMALGWSPHVSLEDGLRRTIKWCSSNA